MVCLPREDCLMLVMRSKEPHTLASFHRTGFVAAAATQSLIRKASWLFLRQCVSGRPTRNAANRGRARGLATRKDLARMVFSICWSDLIGRELARKRCWRVALGVARMETRLRKRQSGLSLLTSAHGESKAKRSPGGPSIALVVEGTYFGCCLVTS